MRSNYVLTTDNLFPVRKDRKECAISSLANLILLKYNDFVFAKKVFENAFSHPLVGGDGRVLYGFLPVILNDCSEGKYFGKCHILKNKVIDDLADDFVENFFLNNNDNLDLYKLLDNSSIIVTKNLKLDEPYILGLNNSSTKINHAVVKLVVGSPGGFVDNGLFISDVFDKYDGVIGGFVINKS